MRVDIVHHRIIRILLGYRRISAGTVVGRSHACHAAEVVGHIGEGIVKTVVFSGSIGRFLAIVGRLGWGDGLIRHATRTVLVEMRLRGYK